MTLIDRIIRDTEDAYEVLSQLLIQWHILTITQDRKTHALYACQECVKARGSR